jgi:RNA polymerase sigma-70 factor, ECF subfamily
MKERVGKRRSQVTYAIGTASASGQSNEARDSKPSPAFLTKRDVRLAPSKTPRCRARKTVETRKEVLKTDALEEMFVSSHKRFLAIAYSILQNIEDSEDAVQTAFLSAYRHLHSFEGRSALRTWLTRIVMNAALMMKRKRKPSVVRSLSESGVSYDDNWTENIPDAQPDPEMIHAERETLQLIDEKLKKLTPGPRQAFTMTYYDDLSGREACDLLGVSSGTFKARLFHARKRLLKQTERASVAPLRRRHFQHSIAANGIHSAGK